MYSRSHISYEECWHIFNQPIYDFVGEAVILLLYIYNIRGKIMLHRNFPSARTSGSEY